MNQGKAAGPKTELVGVSQRMQQSIEEMIAAVSRGVADCMENARNASPQNPYERERSDERSDAAKMMTTTAELLASISKMKGEFSHNYHIVRDASAEERALRDEKKWEAAHLRTQREVDDMSDEEYVDYHRKLKRLPPKFSRSPALDERSVPGVADEELAALEEEVKRVEKLATTPLPENRGSNTDAGKS
jgi:hypothetical protein